MYGLDTTSRETGQAGNLDVTESQEHSRELSTRQKIVVVVIDMLLVIEVFVAMFHASTAPDTFTATFVKLFFAMMLPTLALGYLTNRVMRRKADAVTS